MSLDHGCDQPLNLAVAAELYLTILDGLFPVADLALPSEEVEVRARHRNVEARILGLALRDLRPRRLDPENLDITSPAQLEPQHDPQSIQWSDLSD